MPDERTTTCRECGRDILEGTARRTGGLCRQCEKRPGQIVRAAEFEKQREEGLTIGERTVLAVESFFGETCNGGINQYLVNEGGAFAQELPEALTRCGLLKYAPIAHDLRKLFSGEIPRDPTERWARVSGIESRTLQRVSRSRPRDKTADLAEIPDALLAELTDRFFEFYFPGEGEELNLKLAAYIRSNPSDFILAPGG